MSKCQWDILINTSSTTIVAVITGECKAFFRPSPSVSSPVTESAIRRDVNRWTMCVISRAHTQSHTRTHTNKTLTPTPTLIPTPTPTQSLTLTIPPIQFLYPLPPVLMVVGVLLDSIPAVMGRRQGTPCTSCQGQFCRTWTTILRILSLTPFFFLNLTASCCLTFAWVPSRFSWPLSRPTGLDGHAQLVRLMLIIACQLLPAGLRV